MACDEKVFSGVNAPKMTYVRAELRRLGLTVPDTDSGKITSAEIGVEAEFTWSAQAETLSIQIFQKPVFLPCAFIYGRLSQSLKQYPGP
ncbi:MAG: hypothetical protein AAGN35_21105 [Bacteroidota bacterium]